MTTSEFQSILDTIQAGWRARDIEAWRMAIKQRDRRLLGLIAAQKYNGAGKPGAVAILTDEIEQLDALIKSFDRIQVDEETTATGPTKEALMKRRMKTDTLERLNKSGAITLAQLTAGQHIAAIYTATIAEHMPRISKISAAGRPPRQSGRKYVDMMPEDLALDRHQIYLPWTLVVAQMEPKGKVLPLVIDIVVDSLGMRYASELRGMAYRRGLRCLKDALDAWHQKIY